MSGNRSKFGMWLESYCNSMDISQNKLAQRLGMSNILLCKYATGKKDISDKTLLYIAKELELDSHNCRLMLGTAITDNEIKRIEQIKKDNMDSLSAAVLVRFGRVEDRLNEKGKND